MFSTSSKDICDSAASSNNCKSATFVAPLKLDTEQLRPLKLIQDLLFAETACRGSRRRGVAGTEDQQAVAGPDIKAD